MLQDMDHMEATCVFYVKVCTLNQLEQTKICVLTVILFRIVTLTVCSILIVSVYFL